MDTRPPNLWFFASYALLVALVVIGFYWQAQTIDQVKDNTAAIEHQVEVNHDAVRLLCGVILEVADEPLGARVTAAFAELGVECMADGVGP